MRSADWIVLIAGLLVPAMLLIELILSEEGSTNPTDRGRR